MTTLFFTIFYFLYISLSFSQDKEYYTLHNEGVKIQKEIVYLYFDKNSPDNSIHIQNDTIQFIYQTRFDVHKDTFEIITNTFQNKKGKVSFTELNKNAIKPIVYSIEKLYKIEEKQIEKARIKVEKETGFKGLPPLNNTVLDVRICVLKHDNTFYVYKVNWLDEMF